MITPVNKDKNPEDLKGDESNAILHALDAAVKVTTARAERQNRNAAAHHRVSPVVLQASEDPQSKPNATLFQRVSLGRKPHEPSIITKAKNRKASKDTKNKEQKRTARQLAKEEKRSSREALKEEKLAAHELNKEQRRTARETSKEEKHASHHSDKLVIFFRFSYYDVAFKYLIEQCMDANYVKLPPRTKRTIELGSRYSTDYVCTPFKHILGDYIEALEAGADVIVTMAGPCRLGYYGEVHSSILRDLGYEFETLNFSELRGVKEYINAFQNINPHMDVAHAIRNLLTLVKMVQDLDEVWDFYLANAGFETEPGSFDAALAAYYASLDSVTDDISLAAAHNAGMAALRALPTNKPANPIRVGIVGELYTAIDQDSNLNTEHKLLKLGVELHKRINLTNRYLNYSEVNLRAGASEYLRYDMGPTSTLTIAAAKQFAESGFDGIVHIKSAGCTPEIDCVPVLQEIARDYHIPTLYLTFDSQTSDAGLDTRLEAFYDMLAMQKGSAARYENTTASEALRSSANANAHRNASATSASANAHRNASAASTNASARCNTSANSRYEASAASANQKGDSAL